MILYVRLQFRSMPLEFSQEAKLRGCALPALPRQKAVKPLRDMGIFLEGAEMASISGHHTVRKVEEISQRHLISSKILLL